MKRVAALIVFILFVAVPALPQICCAAQNGKMNAEIFKNIKNDHKKVMKLFEELDKASASERGMYIVKIKKEIIPHMEAELTTFYKHLQEKHAAQKDVLKAIEEHETAKKLLHELEVASEQDFPVKFSEFKAAVQEHIRLEEGLVFAKAESSFNQEELEGMNERFTQEKQRFGSSFK